MTDTKYFDKESDNELINTVRGNAGKSYARAAKMELERRMNIRLSNSIASLKNKVNILNLILVVASIIGSIATALLAYKSFFP